MNAAGLDLQRRQISGNSLLHRDRGRCVDEVADRECDRSGQRKHLVSCGELHIHITAGRGNGFINALTQLVDPYTGTAAGREPGKSGQSDGSVGHKGKLPGVCLHDHAKIATGDLKSGITRSDESRHAGCRNGQLVGGL